MQTQTDQAPKSLLNSFTKVIIHSTKTHSVKFLDDGRDFTCLVGDCDLDDGGDRISFHAEVPEAVTVRGFLVFSKDTFMETPEEDLFSSPKGFEPFPPSEVYDSMMEAVQDAIVSDYDYDEHKYDVHVPLEARVNFVLSPHTRKCTQIRLLGDEVRVFFRWDCSVRSKIVFQGDRKWSF